MTQADLTLPTFYFVATDFGRLGLGSANDLTPDRDRAYDDYAGCRDQGQPARAFMVEFDVETNAPESITDITADLAGEYSDTCAARGDLMAAE